ncbi:MAG: MFS transporter [Clostridia bacterium]|nr:MFS transporter [Clostridia bacterium]
MSKKEKFRFTKKEKSWIMYDWANSVYATNVLAAIFPIYFGNVCKAAGADNVVLWSYGTSAATFIVALLAPFLGALGDNKGFKKKFFTAFMFVGVLFTLSCAFVDNFKLMLIGYALSHIGFSGANLFYDAFITDVTNNERMDRVSSMGYAMGYIGGSTIPFIGSIVVLVLMGMDNPMAFKVVMMITSLWWFLFSIPFLKNVHQEYYIEENTGKLISSSFKNLWHTAKNIVEIKGLLIFILAYFFYIDGVNTVISISTSYGSILGLNSIMMILALLVTQIVAVPCSIIFGKLSSKYGSIKMLCYAVGMYILVVTVGFFMGFIIEQNPGSESALMKSQVLFWVLAFLVGTVQGGIQAISRSYFGKLIPADRSNEYFGFFDIFGKFAAVIGPLLVAFVKQLTGRDSVSVISLAILFTIALVLLITGRPHFAKAEAEAAKNNN